MRCIAVCIIHRGLRYLFQGYGKSISSGKAIREQQQCSSSNICLIPFKAKAWLGLKERKLNGDQVDSKNIKKHKNDVFRLAQLITANPSLRLYSIGLMYPNGVLIRYCVQIESLFWGMLEADGIFLFKLSLYVINKSQV